MVDDAERTGGLGASFPREAVRAGLRCADWREAVREAGKLLVATGAATDDYVDAIVRAVEELGPYIVLAPGIALAHARPEDGGVAVGFSLVTLAEPVEFGSEHNDPVDLVFAFASPDSEQHITALAALADFIESDDNLARIRAANDDEELYRVIQEAN
ncbi:MAG: PTS sugar transporter subunit IIA [Actinomycetes bacterium]|nr:PTS sugar transporter subunit IIA [Acidimicrobiia bacterium]